jgi:hypothetical protein
VEGVLRRASKCVPGLGQMEYEERHKALKLLFEEILLRCTSFLMDITTVRDLLNSKIEAQDDMTLRCTNTSAEPVSGNTFLAT